MAAVINVGQSVFYKIAGVSGLLAVIAGAYGSHGKRSKCSKWKTKMYMQHFELLA